jgi:hypothetical protein
MNEALAQFVQRVVTDPEITAELTGAMNCHLHTPHPDRLRARRC